MLTITVESREPASDPFEDCYVDVCTFRTHFWQAGKSGSAVILLAGNGYSVLEWQNNIAALATRHRVYALDMLGHGLTDKPQKNCYAIADLARFTLAFLSAQGETSAHFVGNSLGGRIALECARLARPREIHGSRRAGRDRARNGANHASCESAGRRQPPDVSEPNGNADALVARVSRPVICHGRLYRDEICACPRARCASGGSQNTAKLSLSQRISDRKGRGPPGRHVRNPPANTDYLGTTGQACAAGSRPHSRSEVAAVENDYVQRMRSSSAA